MGRPKLTDAERAATAALSAKAIRQAFHGRDPATFTADDWAVIAKHAGELQRRSRLLAGLGRGG